MQAAGRQPVAPERAGRDFASSLGCFLMITEAGRIDAVEALWIDAGCRSYELRLAGLNLSVLLPLVAREERSSLLVRVDCGAQAQTRYLMRLPPSGSARDAGSASRGRYRGRAVPALGSAAEIIARVLDAGTLPVIAQAQLERIMAERRASDARGTPLHLPVRSLGLRPHLPPAVRKALRALALENAEPSGRRATALEGPLGDLRAALRSTVLGDYLLKCVWLDHETGRLGNLADTGAGVEFKPFDADDPDISMFLCALAKDPYGEFVLDFREFANVLPTPSRSHPWLGPTVHVYKEAFRREHGLDEHYSLYAGYKALCAIGAPVLVYRGHNPLRGPTEIRFLKVSDRSINLLQGRILEGPALEQDVRGFTAQDLVW